MTIKSDIEDLPDWMLDQYEQRIAAPYPTFEDFSQAMIATAANEKMLSEIRWLYMNSEEITTLYKTFDLCPRANSPVQRALQLSITSSRKYTRIKFPNCPKLVKAIGYVLRKHRCAAVGNDHRHDLYIEVTIPRLGCGYETLEHEIPGLDPD